jgi:SpoVK/Ycf46/Vps4 family AAA+-type ATPase
LRGEILTKLLTAHAEGDERAFRKAALALAASESDAGHIRIAEEIRRIVAELPLATKGTGIVTDIAQPRGELADILEGGHRSERWSDIVLASEAREVLQRVLRENRARSSLEQFSVEPRRHLLFYGPPGCGKTLAAAVLAGELGLPLMTIRLAGLFSRFLGATANHLRAIFGEMPRRPAVYLFDEFDSVAKARGDEQDVGEMRRIVTSFLQLMDADRSASLIIAATNHAELLDRASFRRFDLHVEFACPDRSHGRALLELRLGAFGLPNELIERLSGECEGLSYAEIAIACDDAIRSMALDGRTAPSEEELIAAFRAVKRRHSAGAERTR